MGSRRNFTPASQQFDERKITRNQVSFAAGMFEDIPASKSPTNSVRKVENYRCFEERLDPRFGSIRYGSGVLPLKFTGKAATKATTPVGGYYQITVAKAVFSMSDDYIGALVVWSDNVEPEEIISYQSSGSNWILNVVESTTHSGTISIRNPFLGWFYHKGQNQIVFQMGDEFFKADYTFTTVTKIYSRCGNSPARSRSTFQELGSSVIVFNQHGIFSIDLSIFGGTYHKINTAIPTDRVIGSDRSTTAIYGYRYIYTMVELSQCGKSNRLSSGVQLTREIGRASCRERV